MLIWFKKITIFLVLSITALSSNNVLARDSSKIQPNPKITAMKGHSQSMYNDKYKDMKEALIFTSGEENKCSEDQQNPENRDHCFKQLTISGTGIASDVLLGSTQCPDGYEPVISFGDKFTYTDTTTGELKNAIFTRETVIFPTSKNDWNTFNNKPDVDCYSYTSSENGNINKTENVETTCGYSDDDNKYVAQNCWPYHWPNAAGLHCSKDKIKNGIKRTNSDTSPKSFSCTVEGDSSAPVKFNNEDKTLEQTYVSIINQQFEEKEINIVNLENLKPKKIIADISLTYMFNAKTRGNGDQTGCHNKNDGMDGVKWYKCKDRWKNPIATKFEIKTTIDTIYTFCHIKEGFYEAVNLEGRAATGDKYSPNTVICGKVKQSWKKSK